MNRPANLDGWVNANEFNINVNKTPYEELAPYGGLFVAWNVTGTKILASAPDCEDLQRKVEAAGLRLGQVVIDYIPTEEETTFI